MEQITSRENLHIKNIIKLMSSKKERREQNAFVIEGIRLLGDAVSSGVEIKELFYTEEAFEKYPEEISDFIKNSNACFILSSHLSDKISDTSTPQGVYGICEMLDNQMDTDKICLNGRMMLLHSLQDPGNLGTIIRSCEALGMTGMILSADCPDVYSPKVLRGSMGGVFRLPLYVSSDLSEMIGYLRTKGIKVYAAALRKGAKTISEMDLSGSVAVLIGNEGNGLPEELIACCDEAVIIPMQSTAESLNASVAAGIIAWELTKK